jgi:transcriptional regulator with XRE-family HTH domain
MKQFARHKLRNIRNQKGFSLEMTARLMALQTKRKLTRAALSHWEQGRTQPSLASVCALAEVFDVEPDYFFAERPNCLFDYRGFDPAKFLREDEVEPRSKDRRNGQARGRASRGTRTEVRPLPREGRSSGGGSRDAGGPGPELSSPARPEGAP